MAKTLAAAKTSPQKPALRSLQTVLRYVLIIGGIIGIAASLAITMEKFDLLQHPNAHFICDLNPVISCGSVMESKQANAFGFMNTYIGLIGFPIVATIGVAMLAGAQFKRWFWRLTLAGIGLGSFFAYWLLFESVYRINALCPYCLSVDIAITTVFWYLFLYGVEAGHVRLPQKLSGAAGFARRHHVDILVLWFIIVTVLILKHFWYYYGQFL